MQERSTSEPARSEQRAPLDQNHEFFRAVGALDLDRVRELLDEDPSLANADVRGRAQTDGTWGWGASWGDPEDWMTSKAVHYAAYGHTDLLKLLIEYGADLDALGYEDNHGWAPPLVLSCWEGTRETVDALLDAGANPNIPSICPFFGVSALHSAIEHWDPPKIESLLRHGARHDIYSASIVGDLDFLKQQLPLLTARYRSQALSQPDPVRNRTALEWNVLRRHDTPGQRAVADYLIEQGAEMTPVARICLGMLDSVRDLVRNQPGFVSRPLGGDPAPPLTWAVRAGQPEVAKYLLSAGADPNVGWFTVAWDDVSPELVDLLVKAGANFDGTENEVGELTLFGRLEAAEVLLRHGADIDSKDHRGLTPLQALVEPGRGYVDTYYDPFPAARFLLDRGADVNALSDDGKTALDMAIEQDKGAMAGLLREHRGKRSEELSSHPRPPA